MNVRRSTGFALDQFEPQIHVPLGHGFARQMLHEQLRGG